MRGGERAGASGCREAVVCGRALKDFLTVTRVSTPWGGACSGKTVSPQDWRCELRTLHVAAEAVIVDFLLCRSKYANRLQRRPVRRYQLLSAFGAVK